MFVRASGGSHALKFLLALCFLIAGACSREVFLHKIASPEDRAMSLAVIQSLQSGDSSFIQANLTPDLRPQMTQIFPQMQRATPSGAGATEKLVDAGVRTNIGPGSVRTRDSSLAYEVDQGSRHALVMVSIERQGNSAFVTGVHVNPLARSVADSQAFTLVGKSALQYLFLTLAILSPLTILFALVMLFRAKGIKRKWLWTIGCLFGVGQFAINWDNSAVAFQPLYVQLLGAFCVKTDVFSAWRLGFGIPLVAIWFLIYRARIRSQAAQQF